ncbi:MAG: hypothetical protein UT10_C0031G0008, partial [Candidatus Woesebacteria bacterium GW2011_GWB1_38_8b]
MVAAEVAEVVAVVAAEAAEAEAEGTSPEDKAEAAG